jgi:hypothetical protein
MNTPLPVYIKSHKGIKSNPLVSQYNLNLVKASLRSFELPENAITISRKGESTIYRYTHNVTISSYNNNHGWSNYAQIIEYPCDGQRAYEYSGRTPNGNTHNNFMETFRSISPIIDQLFSR